MHKRDELKVAQQIIELIREVGEAVDYDSQKIENKINYARSQQRREFGLIPSLVLALAGLINSPVEFGQPANDLVELRAKASEVAGLDPLIASEIAIVKGRHSILSSDFEILDPIKPDFEGLQELIELAVNDLIEKKRVNVPKLKKAKVVLEVDEDKWDEYEDRARKTAETALEEIKAELEAHKASLDLP